MTDTLRESSSYVAVANAIAASESGAPRIRGESTMNAQSSRYFTVEQLEELAVAKYIEAALTADDDEREELLVEAKRFASRAKMKSWLMGEIGIAPPRRDYH